MKPHVELSPAMVRLLPSVAELVREGVSSPMIRTYISAMTSPVKLPGGAS